MKTSLLSLFAFTLLLSLGSFPAPAADEHPDSNKWKVTTVRWIEKMKDDWDVDEKYVVLIGTVTMQVDDDTYYLDDGTGTILLDCDFALPTGKRVVVRGEINQALLGIGELELDVESWRLEKKD